MTEPPSPRRLRVALVLAVVSDLSGSGGAERHFSQLHEHLVADGAVDTVLLTARSALQRLREAGRLVDARGVRPLPLGSRPGCGVIGVFWLTLVMLWETWRGRFDVVHVCLPTPVYVPYAALITRLPKRFRPKLAINVIDCTLAPSLVSGVPATDVYEAQVVDAHRMFFTWSRLDGVYSWYEAFVRAARSMRLLPPRAAVQAARYCFADVDRFRPASEKSRTVVYAGRLSAQKRPLLFVDAVALLRRRHPAIAASWRFEMYGSGVLESAVGRRIAEENLGEVIALRSTPDLSPVFAASQLFVSTQAVENFTSLAMLEAMAAGNAIVAERVGQTGEFVRHGENGTLVSPASPESFAEAIADYIQHPERHDRMACESRRIATEVHTIAHSAADIVSFWRSVAGAAPR